MKRQSALASLLRWSALALPFGASCHDYARFEHQQSPSSDGGEGAGAPGSTKGGSPQADSGETGGAGSIDDPRGGGQAGESPFGDEAGSGGEGGATSPPSMFGTVLIHTGGKACAGTLQTNAWVLTAGHCIPPHAEPADILVALGSERDSPRQTATVQEIARFGTPAEFRDLALLRLEIPFTLNGSATGYRRSFYPGATEQLQGAGLLCLGWDFSREPGESDSTQTEALKVEDIETGSTPTAVSGVTLWLQSGLDEDSNLGGITQAADEGGGCFVGVGDIWQQVAVQLENSSTDPQGLPSNGQWARAASLTDSDTRHWMLRTMLGQAPLAGVAPLRGLSATLGRDGAIVLLWTSPLGSMMRASLKDPSDSEDLGRPEGVEFVEQRPGVALYGDRMLVVGYGNDGKLWYRLLDGDSASDWAIVGSAETPTSGAALVNVGGTVHLFALGAAAELRRAAFSGTWQDWEFLDGTCNGMPSASSWGPNRIDIVARCSDGYVWERSWDHYEWFLWARWGPTSAEPIVINPMLNDSTLFARSNHGKLLVSWFYWAVLSEWVDLGVPTGKYMTGVSRVPGTYDLFLSDGDTVTHVWWPR